MSEEPSITVITPSLNQGRFIEENIQSVLEQRYPRFEHIVIDGGSIDQTLEILRKYPHVRWVSEPDRGQADAVNKGFRMAGGELVGWLNSDDCYRPGAFSAVARAIQGGGKKSVVMGDVEITDEGGRVVQILRNRPRRFSDLLRFWNPELGAFHQPGIFFRREILERVGVLDESLYYALDYDLWLRMIQKYEFHRIDATLATYRIHKGSKSAEGWDLFKPECERVSRKYVQALPAAQRAVYLVMYKAYKFEVGRWLPRGLRKRIGLPRVRGRRHPAAGAGEAHFVSR